MDNSTLPEMRYEYVQSKPATVVDQRALDSLTLADEIDGVVGFADKRERQAAHARAGVRSRREPEYEVVHAEHIAKHRTDEGRRFRGKRILTRENALAVLPPTFSPRDIDGVSYPALHKLPVRRIAAYTAEEVEALKIAVAEIREEAEQARLKRAAERKALLDRWLNGAEGVELALPVQ